MMFSPSDRNKCKMPRGPQAALFPTVIQLASTNCEFHNSSAKQRRQDGKLAFTVLWPEVDTRTTFKISNK